MAPMTSAKVGILSLFSLYQVSDGNYEAKESEKIVNVGQSSQSSVGV